MGHRSGRSSKVLITIGAALALTLAPMASASAAKTGPLGTYKHIVVIYEENHSFDNLYGNWGSVDGQHVVGRPTPTPRIRPRSPGTARPIRASSRGRQPDNAAARRQHHAGLLRGVGLAR